MRVRTLTSGDNLLAIMIRANRIGMTEIRYSFQAAASNMTKQAKHRAPIYNTFKYPAWAHMPHAHRVGGRLMRYIKNKRVTFTHGGRIRVIAPSYYASYIENGFWHVHAKRHIKGTYFMRGAYYISFVPTANLRLMSAFYETFRSI